MIQASSCPGSVRPASTGSSRGSQASTSAGRQGHRPQAEVAVVDHHLAPAGEDAVARGLHHAARRARRRVPGRLGQFGHHTRHGRRGRRHVGYQLGGRTSRPRLNVGSPLLDAAGVLVEQLAPGRTLQAPDHAVGVAGEVGEHMADAPARQQARRPRRLVAQAVQRRVQDVLGRDAAGHPLGRRAGRRRAHWGGMEDCPSSMSAMTARMNSSASSVMPPATPP